jgi:hypothetical protein
MNRTYLQAIAILMGTAATTFVAAEWRWEPASAGNYLVIVGPGGTSTADEINAGLEQQPGTLGKQLSTNLR